MFDAQLTSRHLDLAARWLRSFGEGFYTIGSAGHESNAAVAVALRHTDPAFLHYRSGAFYAARVAQAGLADPVAEVARDVLRGVVASTNEPIAGGPAQGVRQRGAPRRADHLDDRLPPAPGGGRRLRDRAAAQGQRQRRLRRALAGRRGRRVFVRRRLGQPRHRHRGVQHGRLDRPHRPAAAAAAGLRGQRHRDQREVAAGLGRGDVGVPAGAALFQGRGRRSGGRVRHRCGGRVPCAADPAAGRAAPVDRAVHGPRGRRRRDGLPAGGRPGPRPDP